MRVIQYFKWVLRRYDVSDMIFASFVVIGIIPSFIITAFYGAAGIQYLLLVTFTGVTLFLLNALVKGVKKSLAQFNEEVPTEDVRIINRLKGADNSENNNA